MNRSETTRILGILASEYAKAGEDAIDDGKIDAWEWAFEDVPYELVADAVKRWLRAGRPFFPKANELMKTISVQTVAPDLIPEACWAEVQREARRVGYNRLPTFANGRFLPKEDPTFSHPLIAEAVAAVGWDLICTGNNESGKISDQFFWALKRITEHAIVRTQTGDDAPALPDGSETTPALKAVS